MYSDSVTAFGTSQAGLTAMDTLLNACTFGRQGPTFIITTKAIWSLYNKTLQANARYTDMREGDGSFLKLYFSTLPVYFDDNCPDNHMYFIDGNSLKLQTLAGGNFRITPFQMHYNQLSMRSIMYFLGNLTCGSRRTNGVISSISG